MVVLLLVQNELPRRILSESLRWQDRIATEIALDTDDCVARLEASDHIDAVLVDLDDLGSHREGIARRIVKAAGPRSVQFLTLNATVQPGAKDAGLGGFGVIPKSSTLKEIRTRLRSAAQGRRNVGSTALC